LNHGSRRVPFYSGSKLKPPMSRGTLWRCRCGLRSTGNAVHSLVWLCPPLCICASLFSRPRPAPLKLSQQFLVSLALTFCILISFPRFPPTFLLAAHTSHSPALWCRRSPKKASLIHPPLLTNTAAHSSILILSDALTCFPRTDLCSNRFNPFGKSLRRRFWRGEMQLPQGSLPQAVSPFPGHEHLVSSSLHRVPFAYSVFAVLLMKDLPRSLDPPSGFHFCPPPSGSFFSPMTCPTNRLP